MPCGPSTKAKLLRTIRMARKDFIARINRRSIKFRLAVGPQPPSCFWSLHLESHINPMCSTLKSRNVVFIHKFIFIMYISYVVSFLCISRCFLWFWLLNVDWNAHGQAHLLDLQLLQKIYSPVLLMSIWAIWLDELSYANLPPLNLVGNTSVQTAFSLGAFLWYISMCMQTFLHYMITQYIINITLTFNGTSSLGNWCFRKWWFPKTMCFNTKMVSFWIIGGTPILGQVGPVDTHARCFDCNGLMCKFAWCIYSNIHVYPHFEAFMNQLFHMSCVFFDAWALILLLCLRHCLRNAYAATVGAYADHAFEGVPTQGQRPCKTMQQRTYSPTPSHSRQLLEVWKRNFCLRDHSPIHIFAKWDALRHPALPAAAHAPRLQSAHRHLAATPSSRTSTHAPSGG